MLGSASPRKPSVVTAGRSSAVVAYRDQVEPARAEADLHVARARVERVLDQLLHHRARPLDHLAGRDLPLHRRRKDRDLAHGASYPRG